jgi:predicted O-methyltransferase YrrM
MELFYEPRNEALSKITKVNGEPEMSKFESAFVCGLIKENRPRKILEVGVAAGGTTSIILQCIEDLGMSKECEFFSVDLNEMYYRGVDKQLALWLQN